MKQSSSQKSLLILLSVALIIVSGTFLISIFARGYQLDTSSGLKLRVTGLLSVSSKPKLASVYLNNVLTSVTDDTLNLTPGDYLLKISKEGYHSWEKNIRIKAELVSQVEAQLFRASSELKPLFEHQILNPTTSPDKTKIIYAVASSSAISKENGLFLTEITELPFLMSRSSERQLFPNTSSLDWSKYTFEFSPNSKQVLALSKNNSSAYLFSLESNQNVNSLFNISSQLTQIKKQWQEDKENNFQEMLAKVPDGIRSFVATDSSALSFNTQESKFIYKASQNGEVPNLLPSPPPTQSIQTQQRNLIKNFYYVYDIKEDTNFLIGPASLEQVSWIPYSDNILYLDNNQIRVCDYDATNYQTIYVDSLIPKAILPTPDGYRLIISKDTLYSITLRER